MDSFATSPGRKQGRRPYERFLQGFAELPIATKWVAIWTKRKKISVEKWTLSQNSQLAIPRHE